MDLRAFLGFLPLITLSSLKLQFTLQDQPQLYGAALAPLTILIFGEA